MTTEPIVVVSAADDKYAMPLAATLRSAIDSLGAAVPLAIYVLDGGIGDAHKDRILASWKSPHVKVHWLQPDQEPIRDLTTCGYLSLTAYLRLFIGELLPASVRKVIYLDSDVIVRRSLAELWATPCDDVPCCAVPDLLTPYLNTRETLGRATQCDRLPRFALPVRNYRELGLPAHAAYFNSGILLINVDHWRRCSLLPMAIRCLREHEQHVHLGDQYALNVLFSGQWRPLDLRWNQIGTIFDCNDASDFPFESGLFQAVSDDPWIVHYCWRAKPWSKDCNHPWNHEFFRALDRTRWKRWRPETPYSTMSEWYQLRQAEFVTWYWKVFIPEIRSRRKWLRQQRRQIKNALLAGFSRVR